MPMMTSWQLPEVHRHSDGVGDVRRMQYLGSVMDRVTVGKTRVTW